jgi:Ca2+:H+ antiporter
MARKNKMDLTLGIAFGSCIQIALSSLPSSCSRATSAPQPFTLSFGRAEIGAMFFAVLLGTMVAGEGRTNWYKESSSSRCT